jgi:hypothetical protein
MLIPTPFCRFAEIVGVDAPPEVNIPAPAEMLWTPVPVPPPPIVAQNAGLVLGCLLRLGVDREI